MNGIALENPDARATRLTGAKSLTASYPSLR